MSETAFPLYGTPGCCRLEHLALLEQMIVDLEQEAERFPWQPHLRLAAFRLKRVVQTYRSHQLHLVAAQ